MNKYTCRSLTDSKASFKRVGKASGGKKPVAVLFRKADCKKITVFFLFFCLDTIFYVLRYVCVYTYTY